MAHQLMSEERSTEAAPVTKSKPPSRDRQREPSVKDIIAAARSAPAGASGAFLMSGLTAVLTWASFMPLDWSPLAWICLVPLILLVRIDRRPRWMYPAIYLGGFMTSLASLQWMRLGDPSMYTAWFVLSVYMAAYFPVFVWLSRVAIHRFSMPLTCAVPTVWVGLEFLRATMMTGFAWYFIGHTQYQWIEIIQVSDLVGAYGVSFVVVLMSACVAGLIPSRFLLKYKLVSPLNLPDELKHLPPEGVEPQPERLHARQRISVAVCLAVFAATLIYGYVRRSQAEFVNGPRVALIQPNFTASLKHKPSEWPRIYRIQEALTGLAVQEQPDIVIWPETMYREQLIDLSPDLSDEQLIAMAPPRIPNFDEAKWIDMWRKSQVREKLSDLSKMAGATMIVGLETWKADEKGLKRYNSAVFVHRELGPIDRYDKMHRVIFGEYIPLREELPWLHKLTPFAAGYGIAAGESASIFNYNGWNFAPVICFEDSIPHLVRGIVKAGYDRKGQNKRVDCLVNLTNDGWFHGSSELDQHLITAAFRAVECRTPMVRAVNTGISGVIDGDGVILEPDVFIDGDVAFGTRDEGEKRESMRDPKSGRWHKQLNAAIVDTVPLDNRTSFYVKHGDWFAGGCGIFVCLALVGGCIPRRCKSA